MSEHLGVGPDGANLLGFLAAVGVLETLESAWPELGIRMGWTWSDGWRPVWRVDGPTTEPEIVTAIHEQLHAKAKAPEFTTLAEDLPASVEAFRAYAVQAVAAASMSDRRWAAFAAALSSDACQKGGKVADTALRAVGGGQQRFFGFVRKLAAETTPEHLYAALFKPWEYTDGAPSMRWDPADDRRYAYRADDPAASSLFPIRTVRGANRLAIEALPLLPVVPVGSRLETTCFPASERRDERGPWVARWPIWTCWLSRAGVASLLTHPTLAAPSPDRTALSRLGVGEVFRSRRTTEGRYRNFEPAEAWLGASYA